MQDLPLISFPQFFPQFALCRKVSLFTASDRHILSKIYLESSLNRLRPEFVGETTLAKVGQVSKVKR